MSERRIGEYNHSLWAQHDDRRLVDREAALNACTGAPASIQPGAVVAMAAALKQSAEYFEMLETATGVEHLVLTDIRHALAMYNGDAK